MAVTATLKDSGNSTANASSYTTGTFTPSVANDALLLVAFCHRVTTGPISVCDGIVLSGGSVAFPIALAMVDGVYDIPGTTPAASALALEVWGMKALTPTAGQSILISFGETNIACAWAVIEAAGVVSVSLPVGIGFQGVPQDIGQSSIRRVGIRQSSGNTAEQSSSVHMAKMRAASNGMISFWSHNKNEGKTPNAAYTELCDEKNGDLVSLEAQFLAPGTVTPSASWATATSWWAGIALELAAPSNPMFITNPDEKLYA